MKELTVEERLDNLQSQIAFIGIRLDTLVEIQSFTTGEEMKDIQQRFIDLCNGGLNK